MKPTHRVCEEELHAWLDGELPFGRRAAVGAYLDAHPEERRRLEAYRADGEALARAFLVEATQSPSVRPPSARQRRAPRRIGWAVAAGVLVAVCGFAGGRFAARVSPTPRYAELLEEITGYHLVYARETRHLVEVPAAERDELVAWLSGRLGRKLVIPDLSPDGFTFAGGRMLVINHRPVAQLLYTRPGDLPLGICVTQFPESPAHLTVEDREGLRIASWGDQGYAYVVVGDLSDDGTRRLANRIAASVRG
jgi:anti-sigma factor RsiW